MRARSRPSGISHLEDPETLDLLRKAQALGQGQCTPGGAVLAQIMGSARWLSMPAHAVNLVWFPWGRILRHDDTHDQ